MKLDTLFEAIPIKPHENDDGNHIPQFAVDWLNKHRYLNTGVIRFSAFTSVRYKGKTLILDHPFKTRWLTIAGIKGNSDLPSFKFGEVGNLEFKDSEFSDFSFLPGTVSALSFMNCDIVSLKGLSNVVKSCKSLTISFKTESGLLELLKLNELEKIALFNSVTYSDSDLAKALMIVYDHLEKDRDLLECQSDLIDAGLERFC